MNLLALETATESCSAALLTGSSLLTRSELAPRRHAQLLLPMCDELLAEAGIARSALDAIAVGRGPGAFTGMRLAVSAAQGIALALDIPI
ncbi:MAG: tRNA (adenosine(37)-N6)-threonylcarbamoyltransferase complex dimerization subunit type 1 TsaB, partial [Rhodanobacteraceae bacterium]